MGLDVKVRLAWKNDLEEVFGLVKELALFEKAPKEVTATLDDYYSAFESGLIEILIAVYNGEIIGVALYYDTFSTWKGLMVYLEDFIVKEEYRSKGIGRILFEKVIERAKSKDAKVLKWQVLDWNNRAIKFYKCYDAIIEKEWWNGKIVF